MPAKRNEILEVEATVHAATGLSEICLIDAVANYFKHHHEWPRDWAVEPANKGSRSTIELVLALGLRPRDAASNLQAALQGLGMSTSTMSSLAGKIQGWREKLAHRMCSELYKRGFE
jgi:hypothetical protein